MSKTRLSLPKIPIKKSWFGPLHPVLAFSILLLAVCRALSQPWFLPTDGVDSVFLQNNSDQPQNLWLDGPNDLNHLLPESNIYLAPHEGKTIDVGSLKSWSWLQIKSPRAVPVTAQASVGTNSDAIDDGRSDRLKLETTFIEQNGLLHLANLSANQQKVILSINNPWPGGQNQEIQLSAFQTTSLSLHLHAGDELSLQGQYPLSANWQSSGQSRFLRPVVSLQELQPDADETYFLMSDSIFSQSFVFHSHDPAIIAEARHEISIPNQRKILVAKIDYGHGNNNRDFLSHTHNTWSWQVSQVLEFGSLASQGCDGNPELVEDNLNAWMTEPGTICFWNYKVIRELTFAEVVSGHLQPN